MSSWHKDRYNWLNAKGVPKDADWSEGCGPGIEGVEDMEDATHNAEEGCKVQLQSWKEDPTLRLGVHEPAVSLDFDGDGLEALTRVKERFALEVRRRTQIVDELLSDQRKSDARRNRKQKSRAKIKLALKALLPEWRAQMRGQLGEFSRRQLLEVLIPQAGVSRISRAKQQGMASPARLSKAGHLH